MYSTLTSSAWSILFSPTSRPCVNVAEVRWSAFPVSQGTADCLGQVPILASKAAAISFLESLRVELRDSGITICPGYIVTAMTVHNPYRMPFIMPTEIASEKIAVIIEKRKTHAVIPWQIAIFARLMHVLPRFIYDPLAVKSGRKPCRKSRVKTSAESSQSGGLHRGLGLRRDRNRRKKTTRQQFLSQHAVITGT